MALEFNINLLLQISSTSHKTKLLPVTSNKVKKSTVKNKTFTSFVLSITYSRMPESDILDIISQYETDSKITKIELHSYTPYTTSFKNNDEIRISIQQTDVYPYLHESFLYLEGKITKAGKVVLSHNGFSFLLT